jgi:D-methionine transport system permease protein
MKFISALFPNVLFLREDLLGSIWQTAVMVGISGFFGILAGLILGTVLVVTAQGGLYENLIFNNILGKIINTVRSIPFVILIALLVPFTRFVVGTSIGVTGAIVPMILGIIPFIARMVEQTILELDKGVIEAARAMGISRPHIMIHVLLRESLPGLLRTIVTSLISLIGLSAMAGTVGGGGIGSFAIRYGYARYMNDITVVTVLILLLIVNVIQGIGNKTAHKLTH